ncbi:MULTISPECIES: A24 family peptidase [Colwellia]|nr:MULTISPECIES: prepilin peptidase [Colwellia]
MLLITLLLLLSALYFDLRYQRIPNKLCLAGLLAALALQAYSNQWYGLGQALLGAGLAMALLLPAFYFRYLGAGDVKLMIAVGAFSGPTLLFWSVVYGIIFGIFTSFFLAIYKVGWSGLLKMTSQAFINKSEKQSAVLVPYAPALALGWLFACYLSPEIGPEIAAEITAVITAVITADIAPKIAVLLSRS